ncbi:glycosyltransferase family 2 protein [Hyunsoonleella flava]|uniref:Glycosyltransferase family 2 protein n=1 Tax=Hyunsoonleella flava TaxID=2527939 RepID=A0A4Q9FJD2_9FLAO|nr:glycosyltransferase family A protein [Hyunsoonleella flava]TBN03610.1 glycosyltransferase family 2 protein [Hyunsoonleella flava]
MMIIVHQDKVTTEILDANLHPIDVSCGERPVTESLKILSEKCPDELIVWCHKSYLQDLNISEFPTIFHHNRVLASYNPSEITTLPKQIGYIERSFFLKINKTVSYPTWLMHSSVGGVHASVIHNLKDDLNFNLDFDYFLNSLAKRSMAEGLFCYSEPKLIVKGALLQYKGERASSFQLFKFVKQHYKWVWVFFLFACFLIYEKKLKLLPLIKSLIYKQLNTNFSLENIAVNSTKTVVKNREIDVVIPTIGRKQYLYDVLKDLSNQALVPKTVIIVEQNPVMGSVSELDYIKNEDWPFKIKHIFTHKTGVCNARNVGMALVESEWTFLGDDDNRFKPSLLKDIFENIEKYGVTVGTTVYLQQNEQQTYLKTAQTSIFGAGNSIVKSSILDKVKFNLKYEFNYGEDNDFGMQLRHLGHDVVYFADIKITHLKAPIGGYRTKVKQLWETDEVQPKPSPTIQLLYQNYFTEQQILGYKLLLGLRLYKSGKIRSPFKFIKQYNKQWQQSMHWCHKIQS